jgi:hypothetical protein
LNLLTLKKGNFMKKYVIFLMAIGLSANVVKASNSTQQLENIINVIQALHATPGASSTTTTVTVPGIPQATVSAGNSTLLKSAFIPVNSSLSSVLGTPVTCPQGLTDLHIGLSDSTLLSWINFDFDSTVLTPLTALMNSGMYIVVNLVNDSGNLVLVQLTDTTGKVYASGQYQMPNSSTNGPKYAFIGFNIDNTLGSDVAFSNNQSCYNWIDLTKGCKVLYQQQALTVAVTRPQGASTSTTYGATLEPLAASKVKIKGHPKNWQTPFISAETTNSPVCGTPVSCASGLNSLYVALSDANMQNMVEMEFNSKIISNVPAAFDIVVNLINGSKNLIQVQLIDAAGKVWAQGQYFIAKGYTGGPMYAFIGFNTKTPMTVTSAATNATFVNWVNVIDGCRVQYQYNASAPTTPGQGGQESTPPVASLLPVAAGQAAVALQPTIQVRGSAQAWSSMFTPINSAASTQQVTGSPVSCEKSLNKLHIGFSDSKITNWINFTFHSKVMNVLAPLITDGMYIVINLITSGNSNSIQVQLQDTTGKVLAQGNYLMPTGVNVGPRYAFIGFNINNTLGSASFSSNQTACNWIDLTKGCKVLYKFVQGTTSDVQGGTSTIAPTTAVITSAQAPVAPTTPLVATNVRGDANISDWKDLFLDVTATNSSIVGNLVSCATGLNQLHIGLSDPSVQWWVNISFGNSVMTQLTNLMNVGMYIVINLIAQNGSNVIQVQLTDEKNNVFAQGIYAMPSGIEQGPRYAFIGFNTRNTLGDNATFGPSQTYFNWIDLFKGCKVLYQNVPGKTTPGQGGTANYILSPAQIAAKNEASTMIEAGGF